MKRFGLMPLLLFVLWVGAAEWVWYARDPWKMQEGRWRDAPPVFRQWNWMELKNDAYLDSQSGKFKPIYSSHFYEANWGYAGRYQYTADSDEMFRVYISRFPPYHWWGHLYRPEVWVFACMSIILVVSGTVSYRSQKQSS